MKVIFLSYNSDKNFTDPYKALFRYKEAIDVIKYFRGNIDISVYLHINFNGTETINGIKYNFRQSRNKFWYIPFNTNFRVKEEKPDIVWIQGLKHPLQLLALKLTLGRYTKIIVQHHGEKPFKGWRQRFQKMADKFIDAYLFTSKGNAKEWIDCNIIGNTGKCHEVLEASTYFTKKIKQESLKKTKMQGNNNFLWVGRLNANKDPLTVLAGFQQYLKESHDAKLYMIYQTEELLAEVKKAIQSNELLANAVYLVGKVPHEILPYWFSAADFFISGSHNEATGYALIECMACSCIPIVTDIPPFRKLTADGQYGFLYQPGNADSLTNTFRQLNKINKEALTQAISSHFNANLSFHAIAKTLTGIFNSLFIK